MSVAHDTNRNSLDLVRISSPSLSEPVTGTQNAIESAVDNVEPPGSHQVFALSPSSSEPVTGTQHARESGVDNVEPPMSHQVFALSPPLSEPVTGTQNTRESAVDVEHQVPCQAFPQSPSSVNELVTGTQTAINSNARAGGISPRPVDNEVQAEIDRVELSVPFTVRIDDTDTSIVDYEVHDDTDTNDSSSPTTQPLIQHSHADRVVSDWNDYEISGLKIVRGAVNVAVQISNVIDHFFDNNNNPKSLFFWTDHFSNDVNQTKIMDYRTQVLSAQFEKSTRARLPLFEWVHGRDAPKFSPFPLSEVAVRDTHAFEDYIVTTIMPSLGFNSQLVCFEVTYMSVLLQPPIGGISQVIHTDDYPESERGEWISLLFPCHQQRSTVFLRKLLSNAFGKCDGVKPFFDIGDFAAWSKVSYFGSTAESVDPRKVLGLNLLVYVHVKPLCNHISQEISPVTGGDFQKNCDKTGFQVVNYGPDVIHWTGGLVPMIRVCACCLNGVNYDCEAQLPSGEPNENRMLTSLLFCTECAAEHQFSGPDARVHVLICEWCKNIEAFNPVTTYPDLESTIWSKCVVSVLFQRVLQTKLCTHGNTFFQRLPANDVLFVLFSRDEIAASCTFWSKFFDQYHFTKVYAPTEFAHTSPPLQWSVFWELFLENTTCARARMLCWIGAMITGIGPVISKKEKKLFHGGYPVFFHSELCDRESATNAFTNMMTSCDDGARLVFHEARFLKLTRRVLSHVMQTYWEYSLRCECKAPGLIETFTSDSRHRVIHACKGPTLRTDVPQIGQFNSESEKELVDRFVVRCRNVWHKARAESGG